MNVKSDGTLFKDVRKEKQGKEILKMSEYLYHYTSIEKLALILKNRTIKFNNLLNVDMKGVRIKLRKYPFKQYTYNKGEKHFTEDIISYIDYNGSYTTSVCISAQCPLLEKIEYTDDEKLLKPKIITKSENGINASFQNIGRCKRTYWNFQQEYRYIIRTAPWGMMELERVKEPNEQIIIFNRILDKNNTQYCNEIYLDLAEDAFSDMEVLLAPKTTESECIIVQALLDKYCHGYHTKVEKSKIRVR